MQLVFSMAPVVMAVVAWIGVATLLLAGLSALAQRDLKRILAYSTISQLGYMFLALGVGAWTAAIFHLMTHAFFKALLFLCAGVVIKSLHEEHDIAAMGGLRRHMPLVFAAFTIGAASLAGLPLVTAGFYSKEAILSAAWGNGAWLWAGALIGALITSVYAFRALFVVFCGETRREPAPVLSLAMALPLGVLAALALVGGFVQTPTEWGGIRIFSGFVDPAVAGHTGHGGEGARWLLPVAGGASLLGLLVAWVLYVRRPVAAESLARFPEWAAVRRLALEGFGFDRLYGAMIVQPFVHLTRANAQDFVDWLYVCLAEVARLLHGLMSRAQTGRVRWYAAGIALGALLMLALVVLR
jgi:NADH-quinone oxidoreductase subunit L